MSKLSERREEPKNKVHRTHLASSLVSNSIKAMPDALERSVNLPFPGTRMSLRKNVKSSKGLWSRVTLFAHIYQMLSTGHPRLLDLLAHPQTPLLNHRFPQLAYFSCGNLIRATKKACTLTYYWLGVIASAHHVLEQE